MSIVGCGSSNDSADDSMGDTVSPSSLRLKTVTISNSGFPDVMIDTEYTEAGNILRQTLREDGQVTRVRTFETTTAGLLISRSEDIDQDDVGDFISLYNYNGGSNLIRVDRLDLNMLIDRIDLNVYQDDFVASREIRDIDDVATSDMVDETSGTLRSVRNFEYEEGRVIAINVDSDGDGVIDRREDYSYNPNGTLATTSLSSVTDGAIGANTFVYEEGACKLWGDTTAAYFCVTPN